MMIVYPETMKIIKEKTKTLYNKAGKFNLYINYSADKQEIDIIRVKTDLYDLKELILELEKEILFLK